MAGLRFHWACLYLAGALLVVSVLCELPLCGQSEPGPLAVASFCCDVTPPIGHPLCGGWIKPLEAVDDPLLAKGIVLSDSKSRYVICAVDWCLLQTAAYDLFREKLAQAVRVPVSHAAVQTVHQHNAPVADAAAERLLDNTSNAPAHLDLKFMEEVSARVGAAAAEAVQHLQPFTHIGYGSNRVERFASNRRVRLEDGKIHPRYSSTTNQVMRAAPEGLIDPYLRTVTLLRGERPLVRLHYYASHPQSYYGDGRATSDTVGLAREQLEREEGVPQIYFTGCAGDITAGKYNDGSPAARRELTGRIHQAMKAAAASTQTFPVSALEWRLGQVQLAPRTESEWSEATSRNAIADTNLTAAVRLPAALNLAWSERMKARREIDISLLALGPVRILHLPGEAFLEYQLYAQTLSPGCFVAVSAYGEGGTGYICTDLAIPEGGYEPTDARVGPPSEMRLKAAIADLLGPDVKPRDPPQYTDHLHLLAFRDAAGREHRVTSAQEWARRREHIVANMERVMGPLPDASRKVSADVRVLSTESFDKFSRRKITFASEAGDRVPAWLLVPNSGPLKMPAVLCLHQTTPAGKAEPAGLSGAANLQYAKELAEEGFVTLAPDYPNFGEYTNDVYAAGYASATMKGIWNHMRALDVLGALPEVDAERMAVIGHSLGGHNALFLAAFDTRVKAVVTSCGFNSFFAYNGGDLSGWSHKGYMPRIASEFGKEARLMPFDFTEVLAAIAPRPVFVNAPLRDEDFPVAGVTDCAAAAGPVYALFNARDPLVFNHPDCGHDFPVEVRRAAYQWLAKQLGGSRPAEKSGGAASGEAQPSP